MSVVTRFAPSPTGFLHIGGVRTALFNWLFAKHHETLGDGGKFLLRIEDTDRKRSVPEAVDAILDGLRWLGLDWDGDAISQFDRADFHRQAALRLVDEGKAYRCYCTPEELATMRDLARSEGRPSLYDGRWREKDPSEAPDGVDPVIRLKAAHDGETVITDLVQGDVRVANDQMDDMVLLRGDGTPTYMLAVVVDDHDMKVTHVIRGDDHLTNAFRQTQLYKALGWSVPEFAHIPLIHGADGAKLSKRHGALGAEAYRDMGFLPEALTNYLLRLGWSHGDDEIISREQAIEWFYLSGVGRSPGRFDIDKLTALNSHYLNHAETSQLIELIMPLIAESLDGEVAEETAVRLQRGISGLTDRSKTLLELAEKSLIYAKKRPLPMTEKAAAMIADAESRGHLQAVRDVYAASEGWTEAELEQILRDYCETNQLKMGKVAQPLRAALTGDTVSPSIFEVLEVLGRDEAIGRLDDCLG